MRAESSGAPLLGVPGVDLGKRALDGERRPHRALGVVLLRLRIAEQRHQPVAEPLQHMAAEPGHRRRGFVEIGVDEVAPVLGVELAREARRADEIAEHDRDRAALGRVLKALGWSRLRRRAEGPQDGLRRLLRRSRRAAVCDRRRAETPISLRSSPSAAAARPRRSCCPGNFASYWPRPRPRSHPPTSMAAPHMAWQDDRSVAATCPAARSALLQTKDRGSLWST